MPTSPDNLAAALAKAQAAIGHSEKSRVNPHFKNKYSTLADVWDACRDALTANGLSVVQIPEYDAAAGVVTIETRLLHTSGDAVFGRLSLPVDKRSAQGVGSAISYGRRYALAAFVGVCPDDDDAEGAVDHNKSESTGVVPSFRTVMSAAAKVRGVEVTEMWDELSAKTLGGKSFKDASGPEKRAAYDYLEKIAKGAGQ